MDTRVEVGQVITTVTGLYQNKMFMTNIRDLKTVGVSSGTTCTPTQKEFMERTVRTAAQPAVVCMMKISTDKTDGTISQRHRTSTTSNSRVQGTTGKMDTTAGITLHHPNTTSTVQLQEDILNHHTINKREWGEALRLHPRAKQDQR